MRQLPTDLRDFVVCAEQEQLRRNFLHIRFLAGKKVRKESPGCENMPPALKNAPVVLAARRELALRHSDDAAWPASVDPRAIERVIRAIYNREIDIAAGVAGVLEAVREGPDLTPSERIAAEGRELLRLYDAAGADRSAAMKVARCRSSCPAERERIAQRIRDLVRKRKKRSGCVSPTAEPVA